MDISELSRLITPERISIVAWVSSKEAVEVVVVVVPLVPPVIVSPDVNVPEGTVIVTEVESGFVIIEAVAPLVPPVIVSPDVNVPEGTVIVTEVESGFVIIEAVAPLVPPVIVSPMVKLPLALTVSVMVPTGYSEMSLAKVWVNRFIVHLLRPRFAQSASMRFRDLRAVLAS
jgi:hypothetical protein